MNINTAKLLRICIQVSQLLLFPSNQQSQTKDEIKLNA